MQAIIAISLAAAFHAGGADMQDDANSYLDTAREQIQQAQLKQTSPEKHSLTQQDSQVSPAERHAAWSANRAEYRRRLLESGKVSADKWLDGVIIASRKSQ